MGAPFRIRESRDFTSVTLVPRSPADKSEAHMAHAMAAALSDFEPALASEVHQRLGQAFPHAPSRVRAAAAGILMERLRRPIES